MASSSTLTGRELATGQAITVDVDQGRIRRVSPAPDSADLPWIAPGLVDLQVNGYQGIDLNDGQVTVETVRLLCGALRRVGVTRFLPTLVTAAPEALRAAMRVIASAVTSDPLCAAMIAGIHLEGPFISPEDGARGAHPLAHVRAPDWALFGQWQAAAGGLIRMVTLSPEWPEAPEFIAQCRASGIIPAIGHTAAAPEQIRAAVAAGAQLSTHFGNGAHAVLPRHPNYLWEQLAADDLWSAVIGDGFHLPESVLKVVMRVKGARALLVSDTVALAGMPPGEYANQVGGRVVLEESGRLHLASDPRLLAGSALPLIAGITHLVRSGLATLETAWAMASTRPRALLGLPEPRIAVGEPAELVQFHWLDDGIVIA